MTQPRGLRPALQSYFIMFVYSSGMSLLKKYYVPNHGNGHTYAYIMYHFVDSYIPQNYHFLIWAFQLKLFITLGHQVYLKLLPYICIIWHWAHILHYLAKYENGMWNLQVSLSGWDGCYYDCSQDLVHRIDIVFYTRKTGNIKYEIYCQLITWRCRLGESVFSVFSLNIQLIHLCQKW